MHIIFYSGPLLISLFLNLVCHGQKVDGISRLNFFDTDLLRYTAENQGGNVMVSPASIKSVLAMILEGAKEETAAEIRSALRLSPDSNESREQLNLYLTALQSNSTGSYLENANGFFKSSKLKLKKEYQVMLQSIYKSDIIEVDFSDTQNAAKKVDEWFMRKTRSLISVVEPAHIDASTKILFTNAMYFKGIWQHPFDPRLTRGGCFHRQGRGRGRGPCRTAAMMELQAQLNYAYVDNLRAHAVELPYKGGRYSMILLVPQDKDGSAALIRDLPYMSLPQISSLLGPTDVMLAMPRFTVDYDVDMNAPLKLMRVRTLFSKNANLSGIIENDSTTHLSSIYHRVYMKVDESGTVAAAASVARVVPLIEDGVQIRVDRPFLYFIRDNKLQLVLFEGRIEEPTAYEKEINDGLEPLGLYNGECSQELFDLVPSSRFYHRTSRHRNKVHQLKRSRN